MGLNSNCYATFPSSIHHLDKGHNDSRSFPYLVSVRRNIFLACLRSKRTYHRYEIQETRSQNRNTHHLVLIQIFRSFKRK